MSRLERYLILTAVVVVCGIAGLWAQNAGPVRTVAEETLHVDASSATVLQWFRKIEREKHIVLSYNASLIDLSRVRKVNASGEMTVGERRLQGKINCNLKQKISILYYQM